MIKKFPFNESGVCTNPDKTEIGRGIPHTEISAAYVRGKWTYGVTYMLSDRTRAQPEQFCLQERSWDNEGDRKVTPEEEICTTRII